MAVKTNLKQCSEMEGGFCEASRVCGADKDVPPGPLLPLAVMPDASFFPPGGPMQRRRDLSLATCVTKELHQVTHSLPGSR